MTTEILNNEIVNYIISDVELTLKRLDINVQLSIVTGENYKHEKCDRIISTSFQTMPMLFMEIHIEGNIDVINEISDEYFYKVIINLSVIYTSFDERTNQHSFGSIMYLVDKSYDNKDKKHINMYVSKISAFEI